MIDFTTKICDFNVSKWRLNSAKKSSSYSKSLIELPSVAKSWILSPPLDRLVLLANFPRTGRPFPKRCSKASSFSMMSALFPDSMTREFPSLKSKSIQGDNFSSNILIDSQQRWNTSSLFILFSHRISWTARGYHHNIHKIRRGYLVIGYIISVRK